MKLIYILVINNHKILIIVYSFIEMVYIFLIFVVLDVYTFK